MKYSIQFSTQAECDLRGIFSYIAFTLQSVLNATGQLNRLEKRIASLSEMPERYRAYEKEPWRSRGLRVMPVDNYLVFYIPDRELQTVTVIRIMYGGRDIGTQLGDYTDTDDTSGF